MTTDSAFAGSGRPGSTGTTTGSCHTSTARSSAPSPVASNAAKLAANPARCARAASTSRSPKTTSRAGHGRSRWRAASMAMSSGPIPAGSPAVIAMAGRSGIVKNAPSIPWRRRSARRALPELCAPPARDRRQPRSSPARIRRASASERRTPRAAPAAARCRSRRCAGRRARAAAHGLRGRTRETGRASPGSGSRAPPARRSLVLMSYHAPSGSATSTSPPAAMIGATSSASPHMNCVSNAAREDVRRETPAASRASPASPSRSPPRSRAAGRATTDSGTAATCERSPRRRPPNAHGSRSPMP